MTNGTTTSRKALRHARAAENGWAVATAYEELAEAAHRIAIRGGKAAAQRMSHEADRLWSLAAEYEADADAEADAAFDLGWNPEEGA